MKAYNIVIELTRRCNMDCGHCLRGEPQPIKMKENYLRHFLQNFSYISTITMTGGEPSLPSGMDAMDHTLKALRGWRIDVESFYIATNGKRISQRFADLVCMFYYYCGDNDVSRIDLSNDNYHDECSSCIPEKLEVLNYSLQEDLVGFKTPFEPKYAHGMTLINEGRAEKNGLGQKDYNGEEIMWRTEDEDDEDSEFVIDDGAVCLNCKGNVIRGCDFSYEDQDKPENILCRYDNGDLEKVIREKGIPGPN
jgi:hypothetical protein